MDFKKVVTQKYTLNEDETNSLIQAKTIIQKICDYFDNDCENCPLDRVCINSSHYVDLIDEIFSNDDVPFCS